jgi:hypothetical protein
MKRFVTALGIAITASPAIAGDCGSPERMGEFLRNDFKERAMIVLPEPDGPILTVWVNMDSGTWTVVRVGDTQACIVASGNNAMLPSDLSSLSLGEPL